MSEQDTSPSRATLTLALYWGSILVGLTMPVLVRIVHDMATSQASWSDVIEAIGQQLFAPGYNLFLIAALNATPFVLYAIFVLFHLGLAHRCRPAVARRRVGGALGGATVLLGLSLWAHVGTIVWPDAQGALVYFFLPIYLLILTPLGYALGRWLARWVRTDTVAT